MDLSGQGWAVVDVETTGLHPARDRIVEIGIVRLDLAGAVQDEWTTVVDPERGDTGRGIHGLTAEDLIGAPRFRELLDDVLSRLANRVLVAHNAPFDVAFLQAETVRAGIAWGPVEGLCTMAVVHDLGLVKGRRLDLVAEELGVPSGKRHSALADAQTVASILKGMQAQWWTLTLPSSAPPWPFPAEPARVKARSTLADEPEGRLEALTRQVQVPSGLGVTDPAAVTYLGLLDRVIEDRRVTDSEVEALTLFAQACGISRSIARQLHLAYLTHMWKLAAADDVITDDERTDLEQLATLLSVALPR